MEIRAAGLRLPLVRPRRLARRDLRSLIRDTDPVATADAPARIPAVETTTRGFERQRELDRECAEVTAAVLLASGGRVSSVVVCNLKHGHVVMRALRGVAGELAVDLALLDRPDGSGADIAVRAH